MRLHNLSFRSQSFASLTYLQQHLEEIIKFAEEVDLNTPVTDALTLVLEGEFPRLASLRLIHPSNIDTTSFSSS